MKKYLTLKTLGWILAFIVTYLLGMQGVSKLIHTEEAINNFTFMHLTPYLTWVGLAEVLGVILLLTPRTAFAGAILIGSIMSSAVVMHLSLMGGQGVIVPVALGVLAWVSYLLRQDCPSVALKLKTP